MKVIDPDLLAEFRQAGTCELCGKPGSDPHHALARGMGGGGQLDVRLNLLTVCRLCHDNIHKAHVPRLALLKIIALREGKSVEKVEQTLYELRRRKK